MSTEVLNLKAAEAYKTLSFKASAFKVSVLSAKAHARTFTVLTAFGKYKEGDKLAVWYIRAEDEKKNPVFLSLIIGSSVHSVFKVNPGDVKVDTVSHARINKVPYHKEISAEEDVYFVPDA